ncbi:hypothetical protein ACFVVX_00370 [Kitasatospora sp. NPDC058170]|uniref:hypothetical protein n=1 Tax=Kitasatospora sp. NPDC058170 TaxID=3346364 RepID=UPI0036DDAB54
MRSNTMKLTVAALAAATALSLAACGPDNSDAAGNTAGAAGGAPAATTPAGGAGGATATGGAKGGATGSPAATGGSAATAGGAGGSATAAPSAGATGATGGAATGGAAAGGAAGGLPKAATAVKVGQPATVEFADKTSNINTKLEVTVTGYEIGSIEDLKAAGNSVTGLDGRTLVYVSYTIKNLGDTKLSFTAPNSKFLVFDQEGKQGFFSQDAAKPVAKCTSAKFQGVAKGMEAKGCDIVSIGGKAVGLVAYTDSVDRTKYQASWAK